MLDYDKEQIISALYRALAERDTENRSKFFQKQVDFHTYTSNMIPIGTMDLITKTIREYAGVYEDA